MFANYFTVPYQAAVASGDYRRIYSNLAPRSKVFEFLHFFILLQPHQNSCRYYF